jgi:signal transduction histidine kinase
MIVAERQIGYLEPPRFASHLHRPIVLIDSQAKVVAVNKDWLAWAKEVGPEFERIKPGVNYLDVFCQEKDSMGIDEVLCGNLTSFSTDCEFRTPSGPVYFRMLVSAIAYGNTRAAISYVDITDLRSANGKEMRRVKEFARRLILAQEEERKSISREIHDDLGSRIALLSLSLRQLSKQVFSQSQAATLREFDKILEGITDLSASLRTLSHGLHPAPLRCLGIAGALKALQHGLNKTSGIQLHVVVPQEMPRLPDEVEVCIFRIAQECIQNAIKHSGADRINILLKHHPKRIRLTVTDTGAGFNRSEAVKNGGFGLMNMEERARSVKGHLTIQSSPGAGTEVQLTIPAPENLDGPQG